MKYCALCCIAKDEDLFLKEWIAYHALIGVEHFYIYDDISSLPIVDLLAGWSNSSSVTVIRNDRQRDQNFVYNNCLQSFGHEAQWIGFLDVDEFIRITPPESERPDIRLFLAEFESYAGLGLNWRMFSSSGHESTPPGPVIGNYTRCMGDNIHIKSIVQPAKTRECAGAHSFYPQNGEYAANAAGFPIPPGFPFSPPATAKASVNHYFYKSRECFAHKVAKGNPCHIERRMEEFDRHLSQTDEPDLRLTPYAKQVASQLAGENGSLRKATPPKPFPGEEAPVDGPSHLAAACRYFAQNNLRQALLHTCYAAMHLNRDSEADPAHKMELWTLRAEIAMRHKDLPLAERCIRQALIHHAGHRTFTLWAELLLQSGRLEESKAVTRILQHY